MAGCGVVPPPAPSRHALYRQQKRVKQTQDTRLLEILRKENISLQASLQSLQMQGEYLMTNLENTQQCLRDSLQQVAELEKTCQVKDEKGLVEQQIVNNLRQLFKDLPKTSPLRRPLLCEVTRGLSATEMMQWLGLTRTTTQRVITERALPRENGLLWMKATPGTKRHRYEKQKDITREILNDIAPTSSARPFRICTSTKRKFYKRYVGLARKRVGGHVFSRSFFFGKFLRRRHYRHPWKLRQEQRHVRIVKKLDEGGKVVGRNGHLQTGTLSEEQRVGLQKMEDNVWDKMDDEEEKGRQKLCEEREHIQFRKDASSCHHCKRYEELRLKATCTNLSGPELEEYEKRQLHHALIQAQRGTYLLVKMKMEEGQFPPGTILLTQDFTQLVTEKGGFTQDDIMVWFYYDAIQRELVRHTHHFVAGEVNGSKGERHKADVGFVAAVWEQLFESEWKHVNHLIVFSDGCGRQYKLTRYAMYLMRLTRQRAGLCIDYHYYPSCHGYGICDVIGAQGQRTVSNYEVDTKAAIKTSSNLVEVLRRTKNHKADVAPVPLSLSEVTSRKGIKSWHRVRYQNGDMVAWRASTDEESGIAPLGRFQEGQQQRSLVYTAEDIEDRRKRKSNPSPPLPHANTSNLIEKKKSLQKKKRRKMGL